MSNADRRKLQLLKIKKIATRLAEGLSQDPALAAVSAMIHRNYMEQVDKAASNPHHVVEVKSLILEQAHEAQYLTQLTHDVSLTFLCRRCEYFGPCWGKSVESWHFRCFSCGEWYRPLTRRSGLSEYNMMLCLDEGEGQLVYCPAKWPATGEDNWFRQQAEAYAMKCMVEKGQADQILTKAAVSIKQMLDAVGIPSVWERYSFPQDAQDRFKPPRWPLSKFQGVVEHGFIGRFFRPAPDEEVHVFRDWDALIALVGQMMAAARALRSRY